MQSQQGYLHKRSSCAVAVTTLNTPATITMHAARRVVSTRDAPAPILEVRLRRRRQDGRGDARAPLQDTTIEGATPSVSFYDVSCAVAKRVAEKYPSLTRAESLDECVDGADVVVLCTKPQNCDAVFADLRPVVQNQKTPPASSVSWRACPRSDLERV